AGLSERKPEGRLVVWRRVLGGAAQTELVAAGRVCNIRRESRRLPIRIFAGKIWRLRGDCCTPGWSLGVRLRLGWCRPASAFPPRADSSFIAAGAGLCVRRKRYSSYGTARFDCPDDRIAHCSDHRGLVQKPYLGLCRMDVNVDLARRQLDEQN